MTHSYTKDFVLSSNFPSICTFYSIECVHSYVKVIQVKGYLILSTILWNFVDWNGRYLLIIGRYFMVENDFVEWMGVDKNIITESIRFKKPIWKHTYEKRFGHILSHDLFLSTYRTHECNKKSTFPVLKWHSNRKVDYPCHMSSR